MNNSQEIILAQISAIYDKPPFVKVKTGQMEMILKCVGLGKYYDEYAKYLEPYWYNRGFQNDIESYRIFVGLNSIFEDTERVRIEESGTKTDVTRLISARMATEFEKGLYYGKNE